MASFSKELLSAYLDGEVTPEERAEVERRIEQSPDLREQLDEMAELSQAIQSLSRPPAPTSLQSNVLRMIQERTAARPQRADVKRRNRYLVPSLATLIMICLLVGVGTWMLNQEGPNLALEHGQASPEVEEVRGVTERADANEIAELDAVPLPEEESFEFSDRALAAPASAPLSRIGVPAESVPALTDLPMEEPRVVEMDPAQLRRKLELIGHSPIPGEVLSFVNSSSGVPMLVEFTVVDQMEVLQQVEVLLRQQKIQPVNDLRAATRGSRAPADGELTAVLLDLKESEMTTFLNQVPALEAVLYIEDPAAVVRDATSEGGPATALQEKAAVAESRFQETQQQMPQIEAEQNQLGAAIQVQNFNFGNSLKNRAQPRMHIAAGGVEPSDVRSREALQEATGRDVPRLAKSAPSPSVLKPEVDAVSEPEMPSSEAPTPEEDVQRVRAVLLFREEEDEPIPATLAP